MSKFVMLDSHTFTEDKFRTTVRSLEENGIECILAECNTDEEIIEYAKDADAIGLNYAQITEDIISELDNCKVIVRYGIGVDTIDIQAATEKGIAVCNLPNYCIEEVATHTLALLLDVSRKVTFFDKQARKGIWDSNYGYDVHRLSTLTLGIIGFGNTGRKLSQYVTPLNMKVIVYNPSLEDNIFEKYGVQKVTLDELYQNADVISIHVPLTNKTRHLICKESINKMKDGVIIINTARGPIIHLEDLLDALETNKVRAAGLDVVEYEPLELNSRAYQFENLVITPHSAYNSVESSKNQHSMVADIVIKVLKGESPYNVVNEKALMQGGG